MHNALITGEVLLMGSDNPQPDDVSCCASCLEREGCTAWVFCPLEGGCTVEGSSISLVSNGSSGLVPAPEEQRRQLQLPYLGCRLLSIPAFTLHKDSPQILAKGPAVQFVSGERGWGKWRVPGMAATLRGRGLGSSGLPGRRAAAAVARSRAHGEGSVPLARRERLRGFSAGAAAPRSSISGGGGQQSGCCGNACACPGSVLGCRCCPDRRAPWLPAPPPPRQAPL